MASPLQTRLALARLGFETHTRVHTLPSGVEFSFWAKTHHWKNRPCDVVLHAHRTVSEPTWKHGFDAFSDAVQTVFDAVVDALNTRHDSVPCQISRNDTPGSPILMGTHDAETKRFLDPNRIDTPVPSLPDPVDTRGLGALDEIWVKAALNGALHGQHVEDRMNLRNRTSITADPSWGVQIAIAPTRHQGQRVTFQPQKVDVASVQPALFVPVLAALSDSLIALFAQHPESLPNGFTFFTPPDLPSEDDG